MSGRFNPLAGTSSSQDPDVVYYNADIINNTVADPVGDYDDPQVNIYAQRQYPILQDANDFMVSCIRFTTSGATRNLPLWLPIIQTSSANVVFSGNAQNNLIQVTNVVSGSLAVGQNITISGNATINTGTETIFYPVTISTGADGAPLRLTAVPTPFTLPSSVTLSSALPNIEIGDFSYTGYYINNAQVIVGVPQTNPVLTVYSFTIESSNTSVPTAISQVFLVWVPENSSTPAPNGAFQTSPGVWSGGTTIVNQNLDTDFYYGYTYQNFVNMANTALATAWADVGAAGVAPYLSSAVDSTGARIFTFTVSDKANYNYYMNSNLEALLPNFSLLFTNLGGGRTAKFDFTDAKNPGKVALTQEYPGTSAWTPVESLVVTTSAIPIIPEQVSAPGVVGGSNFGSLNSLSPAAFQPIIADIAIDEIQGSEDWRKDIIWKPSAEFQMVSFTNVSSPLNVIDLAIWWRNRLDNNLYPLRLVNGSSVSVKLLFRRKQMGV
jgi:hypothetical protein